jgi:hypothetical protein
MYMPALLLCVIASIPLTFETMSNHMYQFSEIQRAHKSDYY